MTRLERNVNIAAVVIPFLGVIAAAVVLWNHFLGPRDLAIFAVMYLPARSASPWASTACSPTAPSRRARGCATRSRSLGSLSLQGPVIDWVADHRKHHTFTDEEGDPHSPHAGHGAGLRGMAAGLWHAHVGWLFETHGQASSKRFARDLLEDRTMRRINKSFPLLALLSLALPFVLGFALSGGSLVAGGLSALLWGGLVRIFLVHHITWSINSICHFFGQRRFDTDDESTNVFWLALPSLGEAWHHNHHAFPRSAFHGLRWYELDPSGWLILGLERVGLAWDVVKVTPERAEREAQARYRLCMNPTPAGPVKPRLRGVFARVRVLRLARAAASR